MRGTKFSRQREAILKNLSQRKDHPTADVIYQSLRDEYPHLSLGTVYRNLNLLADLGYIRRIRTSGSVEHYDYDISEHYHFVCNCCGRVMDVPMKPVENLWDPASFQDIGTVESCSVLFYGTCRDCASAGKNGAAGITGRLPEEESNIDASET